MDAGRGERVWRERESRTRQREGKPRGLLKKFYLVGALRPLRRYRTPVRCCWPRWCRAASSPTSCESKESERAERDWKREKRKGKRVPVVCRGFRPRSVRRQLPSVRVRGAGPSRTRLPTSVISRTRRQSHVLGGIGLPSFVSGYAPSLRWCPVVPVERERERANGRERGIRK